VDRTAESSVGGTVEREGGNMLEIEVEGKMRSSLSAPTPHSATSIHYSLTEDTLRVSQKRASHPSDRSRFFSSAFKDSSQMFVLHSHTGCTATDRV